MKFGQLIENNVTNIFLQIHAENEAEISSRPAFVFFKRSFLWGKNVVCSLVSIYFDSPQVSIQ